MKSSQASTRQLLAALLLVWAGLLWPGLPWAAGVADEMAGHRLGDRFVMQAATQWQAEADRSVKILTSSTAQPGDVDAAYVYATPRSHTIGKIVYETLYSDLAAAATAAERWRRRHEAAYPDWKALPTPVPMGRTGGAIVSRLERGAYARIVYYKPREEQAVVVVELEFASGAQEKKAWRKLLREEAADRPAG